MIFDRKKTILANEAVDAKKRSMALNLYALGNVAETVRIDQIIGTDTTLQGNIAGSVSEKASAADEIDAALAKSHVVYGSICYVRRRWKRSQSNGNSLYYSN